MSLFDPIRKLLKENGLDQTKSIYWPYSLDQALLLSTESGKCIVDIMGSCAQLYGLGQQIWHN